MAQLPASITTKLQFKLDSIRIANNLKGVSAAIIVPNQGNWLGVSGVSCGTDNIQPGYIFSIGSCTKTMIAALVLKLQDQGLLNINDKIYQRLPGLNLPNIDSTITIKQLLNHTSGVYNYMDPPAGPDSMCANFNRNWTPMELLKMCKTPYFAKGTGYHYSNSGYVLLGMIVQKVTGSLPSVKLRQLVLSPGGLNKTWFEGEETVVGTVAHPWDNGGFSKQSGDIFALPRNSFNTFGWTSGAVQSTTEDQALFYQYLFNGNLLSSSSMAQMLTMHKISSVYGYGLGITWDTYSFPGNTLYYHQGNRDHIGVTMLDSVNRASICLIINQSYASIGARAYASKLFEVILNYMKATTNVKETSIANNVQVNAYPNPFSDYVTIKYELPAESKVRVSINNVLGQELMELESGDRAAGQHLVQWSSEGLSRGTYYCVVSADNGSGPMTKMTKLIFTGAE